MVLPSLQPNIVIFSIMCLKILPASINYPVQSHVHTFRYLLQPPSPFPAYKVCISFLELPKHIILNVVAWNSRDLFFHRSGSQKSKLGLSTLYSLYRLSERSLPCLSQLPGGPGDPWLADASLQSLPSSQESSLSLLYPSVFLCVFSFSLSCFYRSSLLEQWVWLLLLLWSAYEEYTPGCL